MTAQELSALFATHQTTHAAFIAWAATKGVKIHRATVSKQCAGTQGLTVAWELAYLWYFESINLLLDRERNATAEKRIE